MASNGVIKGANITAPGKKASDFMSSRKKAAPEKCDYERKTEPDRAAGKRAFFFYLFHDMLYILYPPHSTLAKES
ncbi:MAG: hypothetical protein O7D30_08870 [Rickettsia endosymbiont of Ixodes persulcatus]|nr:hypothetical protein [Rickettsia endosymbiont of Ixodes persulcatus]